MSSKMVSILKKVSALPPQLKDVVVHNMFTIMELYTDYTRCTGQELQLDDDPAAIGRREGIPKTASRTMRAEEFRNKWGFPCGEVVERQQQLVELTHSSGASVVKEEELVGWMRRLVSTRKQYPGHQGWGLGSKGGDS